MASDRERFEFAFLDRYRLPLSLLGIRPRTACVVVDEDGLTIRFGPWRLHSSLDNVRYARRTGPYRDWRVIGPRLSLADRGVTFGTTSAAGVCIRFVTGVPALLPVRWPRHSAATVTVADPDRLVARLSRDATPRPPPGGQRNRRSAPSDASDRPTVPCGSMRRRRLGTDRR